MLPALRKGTDTRFGEEGQETGVEWERERRRGKAVDIVPDRWILGLGEVGSPVAVVSPIGAAVVPLVAAIATVIGRCGRELAKGKLAGRDDCGSAREQNRDYVDGRESRRTRRTVVSTNWRRTCENRLRRRGRCRSRYRRRSRSSWDGSSGSSLCRRYWLSRALLSRNLLALCLLRSWLTTRINSPSYNDRRPCRTTITIFFGGRHTFLARLDKLAITAIV